MSKLPGYIHKDLKRVDRECGAGHEDVNLCKILYIT